MKILKLFPTLIAGTLLKNISDPLIEEYTKKCIELEYKDHGINGLFSKNQRVLDISLFKLLKENILNYASFYLKELSHEFEGLQISNSWINVVDRNQSIAPHNHCNSYLSGCFYLTEGSSIIFNNNHGFGSHGIQPSYKDSIRPVGLEEQEINIQKNLLLIFPSYVSHRVETSKVDKRVSIAFNIIPKGEFGPPTGKLYL